jgi:hypothetical protein
MNISLKTTDQFRQTVEDLIEKHKTPDGKVYGGNVLLELFNYAQEQTENYIPKRQELSIEHRTGIDKGEFDYHCVFLAAVLISWAVRMRSVKSNEGQCHSHKRNCVATRKMHSEIYDEWIGLIQETLNALNEGRPGQ